MILRAGYIFQMATQDLHRQGSHNLRSISEPGRNVTLPKTWPWNRGLGQGDVASRTRDAA